MCNLLYVSYISIKLFKENNRGGRGSSLVENLSNTCEDLGLIPSNTKTKKKTTLISTYSRDSFLYSEAALSSQVFFTCWG